MAKKKVETQPIAEETAAAASIKAKPSYASKAAAMAQAVNLMKGMDISKLEASLAQIGHEADSISDGAAASNKASIEPKGDAKSVVTQAMKEDVDALFGSEELTEDFKTKMATIFEATVNARVTIREQELAEEFEKKLEEQLAEKVIILEQKVDKYMSQIADQFIEKNEVAIVTDIRTQFAESFIAALYNVFAEHHAPVPADKVDVVEELAKQVAELKAKFNEQFETSSKLASVVESYAQKEVFEEMTAGLAMTQKERFKQLAEGISYKDAEDYKSKLQIIKEHNFATKATKTEEKILLEDLGTSETVTVTETDPSVAYYAQAITRTLKK